MIVIAIMIMTPNLGRFIFIQLSRPFFYLSLSNKRLRLRFRESERERTTLILEHAIAERVYIAHKRLLPFVYLFSGHLNDNNNINLSTLANTCNVINLRRVTQQQCNRMKRGQNHFITKPRVVPFGSVRLL